MQTRGFKLLICNMIASYTSGMYLGLKVWMLFLKGGQCVGITIEKQQEMINQLVQKLPQIRKEMKISQTEFGKRVGLSRQTISSIERGNVNLSWNNYLAIMLFIVANRDRCKTLYKDDSQELVEILAVINEK